MWPPRHEGGSNWTCGDEREKAKVMVDAGDRHTSVLWVGLREALILRFSIWRWAL